MIVTSLTILNLDVLEYLDYRDDPHIDPHRDLRFSRLALRQLADFLGRLRVGRVAFAHARVFFFEDSRFFFFWKKLKMKSSEK